MAVRNSKIWAAALILTLMAAGQSGCAAPAPVPSIEHRDLLENVAVIANDYQTTVHLEGFPRNKGEGLVAGVGKAFVGCMEVAADGSCSGAVCGAAAILWLSVCGVAGAVGGVVGAFTAPTTEEFRAREAEVVRSVSAAIVTDSLRDQVERAAVADGRRLISVAPGPASESAKSGDYRPLAASGVTAVLEVTLSEVSFRDDGTRIPSELYMRARVRLIRTADNSELVHRYYEFPGPSLDLDTWSAEQGEPMRHALKRGIETLGDHIYDRVFRLYPFPDQSAQGINFLTFGLGLGPLEPVTFGNVVEDDLFQDLLFWTTVDGLRPTLRWQAFPREHDLDASPEAMEMVTNVRYDLIIAREENLAPAEIVYERRGLSRPEHTMQDALTPGTRYFWTIRARFDLNGRQWVTEWATLNYEAREELTSPSRFSYRFKTPG